MQVPPHFIWDDTLSVHVKVLDQQHQAFVTTLEELYQVLMTKTSDANLADILDKIEEYTRVHFTTEEKFMQQFDYKHTKEHIKAHQDFVDDFTKIKNQLNSGELKASLKLFRFLEDWLLKHLNTMDKRYIECFTDHGLK